MAAYIRKKVNSLQLCLGLIKKLGLSEGEYEGTNVVVPELVQVSYSWSVFLTLSSMTLYFHIQNLLFLPVYLQHFAILLKYIIHVAIPDIPTWVREEMAKLDYQRREAFKVSYKTVQELENCICHGKERN